MMKMMITQKCWLMMVLITTMLMLMLTVVVQVHAHDDHDGNSNNIYPIELKETKLTSISLPKPLSDSSSVYDDSNNDIYISGGCDSIYGNEYNVTRGRFDCYSISKQHYRYNINDNTIVSLADMPVQRYRHTAIYISTLQCIVLYGGRSLPPSEDLIITTLDIYNITSNIWYTIPIPNTTYHLSDTAAFEYNQRFYIIGGYDLFYTAQSTAFYMTFTIDTTIPITTNSSNSDHIIVTYVDIEPLPTPRGDVSGVTYSMTTNTTDNTDNETTTTTSTYALISGGFTNENDFCYALDVVEIYNINTNEWMYDTDNNSTINDNNNIDNNVVENVDDLNIARADKVLIRTSHTTVYVNEEQMKHIHQYIYAIGGERPIQNICNLNTSDVDVGTETVPINDIEYYNVQNQNWTTLYNSDIQTVRFRFTAIVDTTTNIIYTFGGQLGFNQSCTCFPTSNDIYMYTEIFNDEEDDDNSNTNNGNGNNNNGNKTSGSSSSRNYYYYYHSCNNNMMMIMIMIVLSYMVTTMI